MSEYSEKINKLFEEEIEKYKRNPPPECDRKTALKLLSQFQRDADDFCNKFWPGSVSKYLPAVEEGTMFLSEEGYPHTEALKIARQRTEALSYKDVVSAFVYGVAHGVPAYRTALPAYLHIKAIPAHGDEYLHEDKYHTSEHCRLCDFSAASVETKMSFMWVNSMQYSRIYLGGYLGLQSPEASSFILREFAKMPRVSASRDDYQLFIDSLKITQQLLPDKKVGAYKELLHKSKLLPLKQKEFQPYLNILGYLDILHTDNHRGVTKIFIRAQDMEDAWEQKNDYGYPVRFWRAKNGIDWARVDELFGDIFE